MQEFSSFKISFFLRELHKYTKVQKTYTLKHEIINVNFAINNQLFIKKTIFTKESAKVFQSVFLNCTKDCILNDAIMISF